MIPREDPCPSCMKNFEMPPGYIDEIVAAKRSSGADIAEDLIYNLRLERCNDCEFCSNGEMCVMCGCFVRYRALGAGSSCPHPSGDRWEMPL